MKKIFSSSLTLMVVIFSMMLASCSDYEPKGYKEVPGLGTVSGLKAEVSGFDVNLSWTLPTSSLQVEGVTILTNGNNATAVALDGPVTSYTVKGQPMDETYMYTVKVRYKDGYISEGVSTTALMPYVELANVSNLKAAVNGRTVTLSWTLPNAQGITAVKVIRDGNADAATVLPADATTFEMKGQPMEQDLEYTVAVVYEQYYDSKGATVRALVPYITPKMGYVMTAATIAALPDDDERAAASWFMTQENAMLVQTSEIKNLDADICPVLWICIDRVGLPMGWENLPADLVSDATIQALREYSAAGGSLYLSNFATQLTVPLNIVPANMAPTTYSNGNGGEGSDVWVINPYLGWDFRDGNSDQGFYDRTFHAIYQGLTLEDPNGYGYPNLPLIGPGQREDHNCLWDCNIYGRGNQADVIRNFEVTTNSQVLATWGHVRDHCVAGLVEFYANAEHGRCIANGFAAYEWNQNSGTNPYQHNIEKLTSNILNYLK